MPLKEKRYKECPTCYTVIAYLNGVCPECGDTCVVEEKEPAQEFIPQRKPKPRSDREHH